MNCGTTQQPLQKKLLEVEKYENVQITSTQAPSLNSFREKKQYETVSFFKLTEVNCHENWLLKGSTPPKSVVLMLQHMLE